jgi:hypothetical protein
MDLPVAADAAKPFDSLVRSIERKIQRLAGDQVKVLVVLLHGGHEL